MAVELSRRLATENVPATGVEQVVEADAAECLALARRMKLPEVRALWCRFRLVPLGAGVVRAEGWLRARAVRECVVSLELFEAETEEHFAVRFVPAGTESENEDPDSEDELAYAAGEIDLGEAAVEQFALALDPWPRKPGAALPAAAADPEEGPFAALARRNLPH